MVQQEVYLITKTLFPHGKLKFKGYLTLKNNNNSEINTLF